MTLKQNIVSATQALELQLIELSADLYALNSYRDDALLRKQDIFLAVIRLQYLAYLARSKRDQRNLLQHIKLQLKNGDNQLTLATT